MNKAARKRAFYNMPEGVRPCYSRLLLGPEPLSSIHKTSKLLLGCSQCNKYAMYLFSALDDEGIGVCIRSDDTIYLSDEEETENGY